MNYYKSTIEISKPLPTSSIALAVTNLPPATSANGRVSVFHTKSYTQEILQSYQDIFFEVEKQLNVVNGCQELTIIYTPSLITAPTLSRWCVIFIGESVINIEKWDVLSLRLKEVYLEMTRSVYQMFFGSLINVNWWSDRWVTNGLTRFFAGTFGFAFDVQEELLLDVETAILDEGQKIRWLREEIVTKVGIENPDEFINKYKGED